MMKTNQIIVILPFLLMLSVCSLAGVRVLENGDRISWDGEYYDFRDSAGIKMIKLWVPPGPGTVRGVFISGHGGGGGDSRNFARDENIRAMAVRLGFAVAGLHNFPGRSVYTDGAPVFFKALERFSEAGPHPELAYLPFVMYGSSNGGAATYGFVNYAPERAICFVANVSAGGAPQVPVDEALKVPGVFIMGQYDALIGDRGITRTAEMMSYARSRGARWSWAVELKGHEDGASFDLYMKLVEQAVEARYPEKEDPRKGPVSLREVSERSGWLVDRESCESGFVKVASYTEYMGDKALAGWVLNKDIAFVYRGLATYDHPFTVKAVEFDPAFNPHTDPGTMFSLGGPVADPGENVTLSCDMEEMPDWKTLEFYNGAQVLGKAVSPSEPTVSITLDGSSRVYCITAVATGRDGKQQVSAPFHFFVRDPGLPVKKDIAPKIYSGGKTNAGSAHSGSYPGVARVGEEDSILVSYGLSAAQEAMFEAQDGALSGFWNLHDDYCDRIVLNPRRNGKDGAAFNGVRSHDCILTVRAAHGADGVYLLFVVTDDNDVAWPNDFTGTEKQQFYLNYDAVDVLLDSRPVADICEPSNQGSFFSRGFGITSTSTQYQVACGTGKERAGGLIRSRPEPWDMNPVYHSFEGAVSALGIAIENVKTGRFTKAQEWFVPWAEWGGGIAGEPSSGTRLAFAAGFNDRDEGEHFPPGVTSSGGTINASNGLRWIGRSDPWGSGPAGGKPPYGWGEIELGPTLTR